MFPPAAAATAPAAALVEAAKGPLAPLPSPPLLPPPPSTHPFPPPTKPPSTPPFPPTPVPPTPVATANCIISCLGRVLDPIPFLTTSLELSPSSGCAVTGTAAILFESTAASWRTGIARAAMRPKRRLGRDSPRCLRAG
ncbi:unnamed protein product [Closterium sp. NIES-54]